MTMKQKIEMKQIITFLLVLTLAPLWSATVTEQGITLSTVVEREEDGRCKVTASIHNHSGVEFLRIIPPVGKSHAMYFKLWDGFGEEIRQTESWSKEFWQKSSYLYRRPRSTRGFGVQNGITLTVNFFLDEAFGSNAREGKLLLVSWEPASYSWDEVSRSYSQNDFGGAFNNPDYYTKSHKDYRPPTFWHLAVEVPIPPLENPTGKPNTPSELQRPAHQVSKTGHPAEKPSERNSLVYVLFSAGGVVLLAIVAFTILRIRKSRAEDR